MFCSQLLWIFKYLQRIALLNDRTFIHEDRMVGHIPGKCHFMGHDDHGRMLIRQAAADLGKYFITVNGIGPTITETPMMTKIIEQRGGDTYRDQLASSLLIHRMATTDDCVGPALFLAAPASDFVTGEIIYPTGGLTCCG